MGRKTFDQAAERSLAELSGQPTVVLTHRPPGDVPENVGAFDGDVGELTARLRSKLEADGKDVWLMGGGESIRPFHAAGLVDRWELYFMPEILGDGVPLFPRGGPSTSRLTLVRTKAFTNGILEAIYE